MKKFTIWLAVIAALVAIFMWGSGVYNKIVVSNEQTLSAWAQVENVYQRRADLVPNLVNTVKGAANFELNTLTAVIEARSKASQVNVDPSNLNAESIRQFELAQGGLSSALGRLLVVVERYPDIKANANFLDLQAQLEGTENRITVERQRFNEVIQQYNTMISLFPSRFIASIAGFDKKGYFRSLEGSEQAPEVDFGS